jgi:hypothetical protein
LSFIFLIFYLLNAPGIHLKYYIQYQGAGTKSVETGVRTYDVRLLVFALLALAMLTNIHSGQGIEEIFSVWASVLLASSGIELAQGRSAYACLLSDHEKATLQFILDKSEELNHGTVYMQLIKIVGFLLVGMSAVLFGLAIYRIF